MTTRSNLSILIIAESDFSQALYCKLNNLGFNHITTTLFDEGSVAALSADVVFIQLAKHSSMFLQNYQQKPTATIIGCGVCEDQTQLEHLVSLGMCGYVNIKDADAPFSVALEMAISVSKRYRALSKVANQLSIQLEERKIIDRAKGLLMERAKIPESQAYQRLRDRSMATGLPLATVAEQLLAAEALLN